MNRATIKLSFEGEDRFWSYFGENLTVVTKDVCNDSRTTTYVIEDRDLPELEEGQEPPEMICLLTNKMDCAWPSGHRWEKTPDFSELGAIIERYDETLKELS